ncbi:MFS transporter [Aeromicrobium flavum]|uniref:MFS transporter n=1 Tax=Aeromicrobium flavum TaxID=416568 RepID=A0A512HTV3_9ACTN|nr:MFS transporter [Aeromicrobium flavum]GEO88868.1 MFS transporter [Aeromicrobium flavum]
MGDETTGGGPEPIAVDEPDPRRWRILAVTLVVGFMTLLDVTVVNVAVPSIREGLDSTTGTVQWVVSGYALTFGLVLVAGGHLGDAYGRRRLMTVGLIAFVLASAAVGLAPSAGLVVAARLVQGAAAGLLTPQSSGLIQELFSGAERGRAFGYFGLTVSVASGIGPVLGGAVIALAGDDLGWRLIFLINVPVGLVALVAVRRLVPVARGDADRERVDVVGAVLLGLTVLCLLFPLIEAESGAGLPLLLVLAVPPLAFGFVRWERSVRSRNRAPLLDVEMLGELPTYGSGVVIGALYFAGFTGVFLVSSVWLQGERDLSALQTGLLLTPFALGAALTSTPAGRLVSRVGRKVTLAALAVIILGFVAIAVVAPGQSTTALWWTFAPLLFIAGLGGGGVVSPNQALTLRDVPPSVGGAAGGALQTGQRIGSALGTAALMTVYGLTASSHGGDAGLRVALLTSAGVLALALAVSVRSQLQAANG